MGNIYHAKAKADEAGISSPHAQQSLVEAIRYYECYLAIVKAMDDQILMGRAYGNLGNAHYRLVPSLIYTKAHVIPEVKLKIPFWVGILESKKLNPVSGIT